MLLNGLIKIYLVLLGQFNIKQSRSTKVFWRIIAKAPLNLTHVYGSLRNIAYSDAFSLFSRSFIHSKDAIILK